MSRTPYVTLENVHGVGPNQKGSSQSTLANVTHGVLRIGNVHSVSSTQKGTSQQPRLITIKLYHDIPMNLFVRAALRTRVCVSHNMGPPNWIPKTRCH
jgi:hypothetical protein